MTRDSEDSHRPQAGWRDRPATGNPAGRSNQRQGHGFPLGAWPLQAGPVPPG
ncbi:hypothetical protein [Teichococcus aestuarii]|uniref:hypothetical protein n=1 Tax=Teichococcus aestuarii TaxID=568898 RepID=UPI0015E7F6CB|nr:hypothetical protein [Pseudoroseomonas aestuarii]